MPLPPLTVFDLETTGLDPQKGHRIVEIAGVRIEDGGILRNQTFASFVNPEREIPLEAKQINKITDEDVRGASTIDSILPKFLAFARGSTLIAHNASFDVSFLATEKEYCWGYVDLPECLCTMRLFQRLFPSEFRSSLDVLCRKFQLTIPMERHRALADALLTAEALLRMLDIGKIASLEELRRKAGLGQLVGR